MDAPFPNRDEQPDLDTRLRLRRLAASTFESRTALIPSRIYGGEAAGQALAAADRTVDRSWAATSIRATFLSPGRSSLPVRYDVESHDGEPGNALVRQVEGLQEHGCVLSATIAYARPTDDADPPGTTVRAPAVISYGDLPDYRDLTDQPGAAWPTWAPADSLDVRPVPPADQLRTDPPGRRRFWCRVRTEVDNSQRARIALIYLTDLTMIGSVRLPHEADGHRSHFTTSLSHSVYFHRQTDVDWKLVDQWSPAAAGARGMAVARVFDTAGRLVATAAQEGLVRRSALAPTAGSPDPPFVR